MNSAQENDDVNALISNTPEHSLQRKAAIAWGKGTDHAGKVRVIPLQEFDMNKTIFSTLKGFLPRMVIKAKIANQVFWDEKAAHTIDSAYRNDVEREVIPPVDTALIEFMLKECDFSMEHADGTFLEHLMFCYDYCAIHFPDYSPKVLLLHSILGTATNTFAMEAKKIPALRELLTPFEALHVEAFPSIFRLLYDLKLLKALRANSHRLSDLESISFHRVIDNELMSLDAEDLWVQLNYQLIHFVDFLPVANWWTHSADPLLQFFEDLSSFLTVTDKRMAKVEFDMPRSKQQEIGETRTVGGKISVAIPSILKKVLAAKSVREFSEEIGHSLDFELAWKQTS